MARRIGRPKVTETYYLGVKVWILHDEPLPYRALNNMDDVAIYYVQAMAEREADRLEQERATVRRN